jgi:predicted aconitase
MLAGELGGAVQLSMRILTELGDILGAEEMIDITQAHVDGCIYETEGHLDFALKLAALGARVSVPTSLNATSLDLNHWNQWDIDPTFASKATLLANAYVEMGCTPTWTCAPYQTQFVPKFGQQIAWAESNAIVFANSVIGARTNRYGDFTDICAAITGRVPKVGLHLAANRRGQILFDLQNITRAAIENDAFYPTFGHYLGKRTGDKIPVIAGIPPNVTEDSLKALGAAASSSGSVALFHVLGVTLEARTLEQAFGGELEYERVIVTMDDLRAAREDLTTAEGTSLDAIVLGSPHFSLAESEALASLIAGKHIHPSIEFIVTTNRIVQAALEARGTLGNLTEAGIRVCEDSCILLSPILRKEIRVLMTNSAKYAYYSPGLIQRRVVFGSLGECVASAIAGHVVRELDIWQSG